MFHRQQRQISQKSNKPLEKQEQRTHTTAPQVNRIHPATLIQRAKDDPSSLSSNEVLALQKTRGNRATTQLLAGSSRQRVQPKLTIGEPGDKYEQEADRVAAKVVQQMNAPASSQASQSESVQRQEREDDELMMKPIVQRQSDGGMAATPDLEASINQGRGSGQPLANSIREPIEQAFGADFSGVKVHTDAKSDQLNQSIQARAFTTGQDIFFRQGEYNPGSRGGRELIAHELTHVVQQNGSAVQRSPQPKEQHQKHPATETLSASVKAVQMRAEPIGGAVQGMVTAKRKSFDFPVVQRLIGAGNQPGDSVQLPENQNEPLPESVGAAAKKSALYINRRARIGTNSPVAKSSALGENNPGNLHLDSLFNDGNGLSHLETWTELTPLGGGYVKRVRITRLGQTVMDRVMNETPGTAFQQALIADRQANGLLPGQNFGSVHEVNNNDQHSLNILGHSERTADNLTKIVGEGARFGWLADRLSNGTIGNQSKNLLNIWITIPQEGTFEINPTFQQLWGAWDSAFGRRYIKDKDVAKVILKKRLTEGWRSAKDSDVPGAAPLASGVIAAGQVTSLLRQRGGIALMPKQLKGEQVNGARIVTDLGMTWTSDR